jgi:cob(I)alamin adenosyltransferase
VDELNSALGVVRAGKPATEIDQILGSLQNDLFVLGADLATPAEKQNGIVERIQKEHITHIEQIIDSIEARLKPLSSFIIPGGSPIAAQLHLARTICRRAERFVVKLSREEHIEPHCIVFLNRVSDLLFVLARYTNQVDEVRETPWTTGKK